jgi:hypothetical protein
MRLQIKRYWIERTRLHTHGTPPWHFPNVARGCRPRPHAASQPTGCRQIPTRGSAVMLLLTGRSRNYTQACARVHAVAGAASRGEKRGCRLRALLPLTLSNSKEPRPRLCARLPAVAGAGKGTAAAAQPRGGAPPGRETQSRGSRVRGAPLMRRPACVIARKKEDEAPSRARTSCYLFRRPLYNSSWSSGASPPAPAPAPPSL